MKLRGFLSCVMALLLVCSLPLAAFAEEYDLANGSITVTADDSGQYVTQEANGINNAKQTTETVIIQTNNETSTTNTVTINADAGSTANVTLDGVNIDSGTSGGAAVEIKGNGDVVIELDGSNTVQSGDGHAGVEKNTTNSSGKGNLTITDENGEDGSLEATGGVDGAGIGGGLRGSGSNITITGSAEVNATGCDGGAGIGGGDGGSGSDITITGSAEVTAKGGNYGSGIGGGTNGDGSNITITGSAEVNAQGGDSGSGIGGGSVGSGRSITITGSAEVTAKGGNYGSGIGGGYGKSGSYITITGSAEVTAKGGESGAGIGGGYQGNTNATGSNITVSEDAQVKAQGGNDNHWGSSSYSGAGAAIGDGGKYSGSSPDNIAGAEATPNTNDLNEGWVATYAPGTTDMNTATPNSLTYKDANGTVTTANQNITIEAAVSATSDTHGHEAGYKVGDKLVAVTTHYYDNYVSNDDATCTKNGTETGKCSVPGCTAEHTRTDSNSKLDHEFGEYIPDADNLATCTKAGTKTAMCKHCTATDTVPDPIKEHSFTNYISDGNATYDADGTKTAKCDHCDATDTIPDPGSKLVREETAQTAPLYRVIGQDGKAISCKAEQSSGVLTITVDADFATLTGSTSGLKTLKAQGIDTIVFVTNGATSTFALADLLASMTAGDSYSLTHDGDKVTFTLSSGEDIGKILK